MMTQEPIFFTLNMETEQAPVKCESKGHSPCGMKHVEVFNPRYFLRIADRDDFEQELTKAEATAISENFKAFQAYITDVDDAPNMLDLVAMQRRAREWLAREVT